MAKKENKLTDFLLESPGFKTIRRSAVAVRDGWIGIYQTNVHPETKRQRHHSVVLTAEQLLEVINLCRGRILGRNTSEVLLNRALDQMKEKLRSIDRDSLGLFSQAALKADLMHTTLQEGLDCYEERPVEYQQFIQGMQIVFTVAIAAIRDYTPFESSQEVNDDE